MEKGPRSRKLDVADELQTERLLRRQEKSTNQDRMADNLYQIYEELSAATDKGTVEGQYRNLLKAVRNGDKEKGLASQFITRFAEHFPNLEMETANALFDICEDEDIAMRKQAEKDLVTVSKKLPNLVPTVADVLAQILQTDNVGELNIVHNSLMSLFYIKAEGAIAGIFAQIRSGDSMVRERCFKFLQSKYKNLGPEVMSPVFEKSLFEEARKVLKAVETREQFTIIMDILNSTKLANTTDGRQSIVEMIQDMLEMKINFRTSEEESEDIAKLLLVADSVFQLFNENHNSNALFAYFCTRVLPEVQHMAVSNENDYFSILKMTVDLSQFIGDMDDDQLKSCLISLVKAVDEFLFEEPKKSNSIDDKPPLYNFSFIESIFFLINKLGRIQPLLLVEMMKSKEKFRSKIVYLLRAVVPYKTKLRTDLQSLPIPERRNEVEKLTCLLTLFNIALVGKILYRAEVPPTENKVRLSWKSPVASLSCCSSPVMIPSTRKRRVTLVKRSRSSDRRSRERDNKRSRESSAKIYQPPNGKYSGRTISYDDDSSSRRYKHRASARSASGMERYLGKRSAKY